MSKIDGVIDGEEEWGACRPRKLGAFFIWMSSLAGAGISKNALPC